MATEIQEDCIGLVLNPTLINPSTEEVLDLTLASSVKFRFLSPVAGSVAFEEDGTVDADPTTGKVMYNNDSDQFSEPGTWKYQVKVTFSTGAIFYSQISKIKVKANI